MTRHTAIMAIMVLSACAGTPRHPEPVRIVDLRTGREATFEQMVDDLMEAQVVYVGEAHDRQEHHALQAAVLRAMHARDPSLAVGMEMFQRPFQEPLDAFVRGDIDEAEMLRRTEWAQRWGFDVQLYRPILSFVRETGTPLFALNAPKELTRAVGRGGLAALSEEERASLPELDLEDAEHRALVHAALAGHGDVDEERLERFYAAQVLWDETMADAVAGVMSAEGGPRRMVVLAGGMHVRGGLGIPRRAARRGATPFRVVLPLSEEELAELETTPRAADWLVLYP